MHTYSDLFKMRDIQGPRSRTSRECHPISAGAREPEPGHKIQANVQLQGNVANRSRLRAVVTPEETRSRVSALRMSCLLIGRRPRGLLMESRRGCRAEESYWVMFRSLLEEGLAGNRRKGFNGDVSWICMYECGGKVY